MIAFLEGKIDKLDPNFVLIDVHGVGYEARISLATYSQLKTKTEIKILTYLHIKEDGHTLFGFYDIAEKRRFLDLISISGVGPTTALMVLSSLSPDELISAILSENVRLIQGVKGIGLKTAQRIILELKDKMKREDLLDKSLPSVALSSNRLQEEALSALMVLGISRPVAEKTIVAIQKEKGELPLEELIKLALKRA